MSVLVTGSIAIDQIMVFQDRFRNHILPDKIHTLNVSFNVPELERRWGGTAANIAYNLRCLDVDPMLLGTVGHDFGAYSAWLDRHGIRRDWIRVLDDCFTAQCFITTDLDNNQITSFHAGAMDRAHEAPIAGVREEISVGIVAPNGKRAMLEHAHALQERGVPWVADPGQGLPMFDREELLALLDGATVYVVNDYEWALTQEKTGLGEEEIAARVGAVVVTRGDQGSRVRRGGLESTLTFEAAASEIRAVPAERVVDPTGCGDAYRAGILYALLNGLTLEQGARIGSLLGSLKVAEPGPQSIDIDLASFRDRFAREFGHGI
jgi:adenosine kinase